MVACPLMLSADSAASLLFHKSNTAPRGEVQPGSGRHFLSPMALFPAEAELYAFTLPEQSAWPHRQTTSARVPMPSQ